MCKKAEGLCAIEYDIQLKNRNILVIYAKFYIFDGENIQEGPKNIFAKLRKDDFTKQEAKFFLPKNLDKYINKSIYSF